MLKKQNETKNWINMVPVIRNDIGTIIHENNLISIIYPRFKKKWIIKLFLPKNQNNEIKIDFDLNGSAVWQQIDGNKSIKEILFALNEKTKTEENYNQRVILFLQNIYKSGFITIKNPI